MRALIVISTVLFSLGLFAGHADKIEVTHPYIRLMPPGSSNTGAFMTLENSDGKAYALVGATAKISKVVELHTHINDNGVMRMRKVDKIDLPANSKTILRPGGLHVMFIGLYGDLKKGQSVAVTLKFGDGSKKTVDAKVRPIKHMMKKGHHHH